MQVDSIKPTLKAPGTKHLKLKYGELLSSYAFKMNLRRYMVVLGIFDQNILEMWLTVSSMCLAFVFMFGRVATASLQETFRGHSPCSDDCVVRNRTRR